MNILIRITIINNAINYATIGNGIGINVIIEAKLYDATFVIRVIQCRLQAYRICAFNPRKWHEVSLFLNKFGNNLNHENNMR